MPLALAIRSSQIRMLLFILNCLEGASRAEFSCITHSTSEFSKISLQKNQIANETEKSLIFARFLWLWFDTSPCTLRVTNIDPATVFIEIVNKSQNMSTNTNTNKTNGNIRLNGKLEQNNRQVRFVYFVPFISYPHVIKSMEPSIQRDDIAFRALAQKFNTRFMVWFCVCFCVFFGFQA